MVLAGTFALDFVLAAATIFADFDVAAVAGVGGRGLQISLRRALISATARSLFELRELIFS